MYLLENIRKIWKSKLRYKLNLSFLFIFQHTYNSVMYYIFNVLTHTLVGLHQYFCEVKHINRKLVQIGWALIKTSIFKSCFDFFFDIFGDSIPHRFFTLEKSFEIIQHVVGIDYHEYGLFLYTGWPGYETAKSLFYFMVTGPRVSLVVL